jgi:hypothetical protein
MAIRVLPQLNATKPSTIVNAKIRDELERHGLIKSEPWPGTRGYVSYLTKKGAALAIATEARRAATGNTDAVHEGAGPKDIAQRTTP